MEETPHLITHFMAVGAEKRLEDYHFLRNTYETITSQEIQLNRILRMLGEDEFSLSWRADLLPIGRSRSRSLYNFDRWCNALTLKGRIAYERLRDLEHDSLKNRGPSTFPSSPRRVQELRERRRQLSEQREYALEPGSSREKGRSVTPSSTRLSALAEYETSLAESTSRRQRQAEENRLNTSKNQEIEEVIERKRERFKTNFDDENKKSETNLSVKPKPDEDKSRQQQQQVDKPKKQEDESNNRLINDTQVNEDQDKKLTNQQETDINENRKSSVDYDHEKTSDIELIAFTVRCQPVLSSEQKAGDTSPSVRLLCQWASPSSSSAIDYFTIERQSGDDEWSPIGEKINKLDNRTQLDLSLSNENDQNTPSYFRLKAHLQNGQTFTSKSTDGIFINVGEERKDAIIPDVEILSPTSVQLTWSDDNTEANNDDKTEDNHDNKTEDKNDNDKNVDKQNIYDIEKKEEQQSEWEKVTEVPLSQRSARIDSLTDANLCQFRLIPSSTESEEPTKPEPEPEAESEVLTVSNVNEWLNSLHIAPTSPNTVDVDIAEEGFTNFNSYQIEYTTNDQLDQWTQMSDITHDNRHLTIDNLQQGTDYKFRFTPITLETNDEGNSSHLSLVLDVQMPSAREESSTKSEPSTPVSITPQFSIQKLDSTSVLIEAIVPEEEPATFEDVFDVYSKKETTADNNDADDEQNDENDWTKVGTIDKEHLSTTVENLEEDTAYAFKIANITSPSADNEDNIVQEFKFDPKPVKQYDPSLFLAKIEQSLENVVNGVMQAAAGHQTLEEPINQSLNEVIKEAFRDETLVPNEEYGFDTLDLSSDLQLYRGPKQMMLKELEVDETVDLSKHYGEIIIHNYRTSQQSVIVREENGNTRVGNIDGDIIIRNVVSDVILRNEQAHHQLSMNIVGQAFLKGVQGTLIASKFKGIIVVKNVNKP